MGIKKITLKPTTTRSGGGKNMGGWKWVGWDIGINLGSSNSPRKGTTTTTPTTGEEGNRPTESQADIRSKFKEMAVRTWNLQPASGKIPEIGFKPKSEYWATEARKNGMGMYQFFMAQTLNSFYRGKTPDWAKKAWDIKLVVTYGSAGDDEKEISYCVIVAMDPQL